MMRMADFYTSQESPKFKLLADTAIPNNNVVNQVNCFNFAEMLCTLAEHEHGGLWPDQTIIFF